MSAAYGVRPDDILMSNNCAKLPGALRRVGNHEALGRGSSRRDWGFRGAPRGGVRFLYGPADFL